MSKMTIKSRNYYFKVKTFLGTTRRIRLENEKLKENPKEGNA